MDRDTFAFQLYKAREALHRIHEDGKIPENFLDTLDELEHREKERIPEIEEKMTARFPHFFEARGEFTILEQNFQEDIKAMFPLGEDDFLLFGGHGLTVEVTEKGQKGMFIQGFTNHIYHVTERKEEFLVVGDQGEVQALDKKNLTYRKLTSPTKYPLTGLIPLTKDRYVFLGDQGYMALGNYEKGDFHFEDFGEMEVRIWQTGISFSDDTFLAFGEEGATWYFDGKEDLLLLQRIPGFHRKIYGVLPVEEGFLVFGGVGETRVLHRGEDGFFYGESISGFEGLIYAGVKADEGNIILTGSGKQCRRLTREGGQWVYKENFSGFPTYISAIIPLGKHRFLLGGWSGAVGILTVDYPKTWEEKKVRFRRESGAFF